MPESGTARAVTFQSVTREIFEKVKPFGRRFSQISAMKANGNLRLSAS